MLDQNTLEALQEYVEMHRISMNMPLYESESIFSVDSETNIADLEDYIKEKQSPSFSETLFAFIDEKGYTDSEVYKRAGLDRRLFSKIRSNPDYKTSKQTAAALAIGLRLEETKTEELLDAAGYSLSYNDPFDLVIRFCLQNGTYDIDEVNQALEYMGVKTLW
ncbi:hypothetical protein [Sediminibacillus terrae]|uniref:hypothetical protein n=1 Tax=Sediminibacillus terrae TaxID=1562106 RepID=UPI00041DD569|nr:hypothetical protein [Sediminibacillus terrae]